MKFDPKATDGKFPKYPAWAMGMHWRGDKICKVRKNSQACKKGVKVGWIIYEVGESGILGTKTKEVEKPFDVLFGKGNPFKMIFKRTLCNRCRGIGKGCSDNKECDGGTRRDPTIVESDPVPKDDSSENESGNGGIGPKIPDRRKTGGHGIGVPTRPPQTVVPPVKIPTINTIEDNENTVDYIEDFFKNITEAFG